MVEHKQMDRVIHLAAENPERAARIVAKSFYKVLRKNEFTDDQIIAVANNILECLIESLAGYKKKSAIEQEKLRSVEQEVTGNLTPV